MSSKKILILVSLAAVALSFTGCDKRQASMAPDETNVLGAFRHQEKNYSPAGPATFAIKTDELYDRRNFSGNKTTLLWGLVTIQDY